EGLVIAPENVTPGKTTIRVDGAGGGETWQPSSVPLIRSVAPGAVPPSTSGGLTEIVAVAVLQETVYWLASTRGSAARGSDAATAARPTGRAIQASMRLMSGLLSLARRAFPSGSCGRPHDAGVPKRFTS